MVVVLESIPDIGVDIGVDMVAGIVAVGIATVGDGLTIVVLVSVPGDAVAPVAGTTSVRCSHPARRAALARMQMVFFIIFLGFPVRVKLESEKQSRSALLRQI